ncbi:plancitoxin-1-like [Ptychodera flava]|uniref:plancitoxin-1-like n=1 Tax=Ptychodera flava TaxID=63121 RepID=UPI003969E0DD
MLALEVLVFCLLFSTCTGISCQDDQGMNVDWFIIYNIPEIPDSDNELVKAGVAYYYFDPSVQTGRLSTVGIDSPNQALAKTLDQIYSNHKSENVAYLMYNDEWPDTKTEHWDRGHTKGDVCLDTTGGFWLVQSAPRFPEPSNGSYSWPHNAKKYGQSLLCISAQVEDGSFQKIVTALKYNCPAIFDSNIPLVIKNVVKGLDDVVNGNCKDRDEDTHYHAEIKTLEGVALDIFAKSAKFNEDIYSKFLAPYYKADMYAETWQRGKT